MGNSPFTVLIDGVPILCDTPEAALAVARLHGGNGARGTQTNRAHAPSMGTRWTDQRVSEFLKLIEGKQRKLIEALLATEDGRTDAQLLQTVGVQNNMALAGVFTGLYRNAKKVGADPKELYIRKAITIGDKRGFEYTLHDGFRKAAAVRRASK